MSSKYEKTEFYSLIEKLKKSSISAVANGLTEELSSFEEYMYIQRDLDRQFEEYISDAISKNKALVIILGRVGEGKSRLLKSLYKKFPEEKGKWEIYNDGTESFDPKKEYIETLDEHVLKPFSDVMLSGSNAKKVILAINIGPLDNFKLKKNESYSKLFSLLDLNKSESYSDDWLYCLNMLNSPLFKYENKGISVGEIGSVFNKVFSDGSDNIFKLALEKSKEQVPNHILENFNFLSQQENRKVIIRLLIKSLIKHKYFLSFRMLLNFIHSLIHLDTRKYDFSYSLFNDDCDDEVHRHLKKMDPCSSRSASQEFEILANCYSNGKFNKEMAKQITRKSIFTNYTENETYSSFVKLLIYSRDRDAFSEDVEDIIDSLLIPAISSWNGVFSSNKGRHIILPYYNSKKYRLAKSVLIEAQDLNSVGIYEIEIDFGIGGKLILDFKLFDLLVRVSNGYVPNVYDKEQFILLDKLVKTILKNSNNDVLHVDQKNYKHEIDFEFELKSKLGKKKLYFNKKG